MLVTLRPLTVADAAEHVAGEDEATVRWLNGAPSTPESVRTHIEQLAIHGRTGRGPQGFGVCLDGRLAGYVEADPAVRDGLEDGDVNISYATHPWARGRGLAVEAVRLIGAFLAARGIGARAAIRVEPSNHASVRVAEKSGFTYVRDFLGEDAVLFRLYRRPL